MSRRCCSSLKMIAASRLRLIVWSALRIAGPNRLTSCRQARWFGSRASWMSASASSTLAPSSANIRATVVLPVPTLPVIPITNMRI